MTELQIQHKQLCYWENEYILIKYFEETWISLFLNSEIFYKQIFTLEPIAPPTQVCKNHTNEFTREYSNANNFTISHCILLEMGSIPNNRRIITTPCLL